MTHARAARLARWFSHHAVLEQEGSVNCSVIGSFHDKKINEMLKGYNRLTGCLFINTYFLRRLFVGEKVLWYVIVRTSFRMVLYTWLVYLFLLEKAGYIGKQLNWILTVSNWPVLSRAQWKTVRISGILVNWNFYSNKVLRRIWWSSWKVLGSYWYTVLLITLETRQFAPNVYSTSIK